MDLPRARATDALLSLAGVGLASELIYWLVFVRPFPLARLYTTLPPVDYAKLTGHSPEGVIAFTLAIVTLFTGYAIALRSTRRVQTRWLWGIVLVGAVLFSATLIPAYPTTAIDLLIYAVRARVWALYGLNPLATAPLELPNDPWIGLAGEWANIPSPYGPVWESVSLLAFRLAGGDLLTHLFALKVIAALTHLGCTSLVALNLSRLKPDWALAGTVAFAWNPLALLELAGNGHNDGLMVFFLLLAVTFAVHDRRWLAIPTLTLSIFTKFTPLLALPFFLLYLARHGATPGLLAQARTGGRSPLRQAGVIAGNLALFVGLGVWY